LRELEHTMTALAFALFVLAVVGVGAVLGVLLLNARHSQQQAWLDAREAKLNTIWRSLQAANRLNFAFWNAREAMRREAERQRYIAEQAESDEQP